MDKTFSAEDLLGALVTFNADVDIIDVDTAEDLAEGIAEYAEELILPNEPEFRNLCDMLGLSNAKKVYALHDGEGLAGALCLACDWVF